MGFGPLYPITRDWFGHRIDLELPRKSITCTECKSEYTEGEHPENGCELAAACDVHAL